MPDKPQYDILWRCEPMYDNRGLGVCCIHCPTAPDGYALWAFTIYLWRWQLYIHLFRVAEEIGEDY